MKAQDIMTREVATVRPETSMREIAALMMEKNISGMPVVSDDGAIVGIVSEGDLLHRAEVGTERKHEWWFQISRIPTPLHVSTPRPMASLREMSCLATSSPFAMTPISETLLIFSIAIASSAFRFCTTAVSPGSFRAAI